MKAYQCLIYDHGSRCFKFEAHVDYCVPCLPNKQYQYGGQTCNSTQNQGYRGGIIS